jgi:hypothetical protein
MKSNPPKKSVDGKTLCRRKKGMRPIVLTAILMLAVFITVFAIPAMAEKPDISEVGSYDYNTTNISARIGELYSDTWHYLVVDNCYNEHFAVWVDGDLLESCDFIVKQEFGGGDTAILTAGDMQVNRKVIQNGVDSFKIEYTITNNREIAIDDLRFFQVLDYDIGGSEHDYAKYVPETDVIWMIDEDHYQCGYFGNIPSTRHGCDEWDAEINGDYLDGTLNNQSRYPATGTADPGTGLQWNLGSFPAGGSTSVTVTFWFGVPVEVEVAWWTFEDGCGKVMEGMISDEQEVEWWTFEIGSETLITIDMVTLSGDLDPYLELYSTDGQLLFSDDDSGEGFNSQILDLWLPLGGSYQIAASRHAGEGEYMINLSCATTSPGQPIEYGQMLAGTINDSRFMQAYLFDGNAGDQLIVNMSYVGVDTLDSYVFLFGPNGNILDSDDDSGSDHNSQLEVILPVNGMYRLVLTRCGQREGDSYGDFTASIELVFSLPSKAEQAAEALYSILGDGINETSQVYVIGPVEPGTVIRENTPINDDEWEIARLEVPYTCFVFFIDDKPEFRFVHPVRYAWIDLPTGDYDVIQASLRPVIEDEYGVPHTIKPGGSGVVHNIKTIYGEANRGYSNILGVRQVDQAVSYQQSTEQTDQSDLSHAMIGFGAVPRMTAMYGQGGGIGNIDNSVISQSAQASKVVPVKKMALVVDGGDKTSLLGMSDQKFAKEADNFAKYLRKKGYRVARYSQYWQSSHPSLETASTSIYWENFLKVIEKIAKEMNKTTPTSGKHEFFLYYSGHGLNHNLDIWRCTLDLHYWLPYDKVSKSLAKFNKSCVTITIFLDTCRSGSASKSLAGVCKSRTAPVTLITTTDAKEDAIVPTALRDSGTENFLEASGDLKKRWKYMKNEWWNTNPQFCTCQGGKFSCL